ncbi:MAG TPA: hypothetical protein VMS99_09055 [Acidimicrobiia bacterium]|nr:hypothetical protein [Acidimicrobiia bacterium]
MTRLRRLLSMATAATAVLVLGFVVAVAASSLPGSGGSTPLLDLQVRTELDLTPVFAWVLLAMAVIGAVLMALGFGRPDPGRSETDGGSSAHSSPWSSSSSSSDGFARPRRCSWRKDQP